MDRFRSLKRTADGLEIESLGTTIPEGTPLLVRRSSFDGRESLACVVRSEGGADEQGGRWVVVTDVGETLAIEAVIARLWTVADGASGDGASERDMRRIEAL